MKSYYRVLIKNGNNFILHSDRTNKRDKPIKGYPAETLYNLDIAKAVKDSIIQSLGLNKASSKAIVIDRYNRRDYESYKVRLYKLVYNGKTIMQGFSRDEKNNVKALFAGYYKAEKLSFASYDKVFRLHKGLSGLNEETEKFKEVYSSAANFNYIDVQSILFINGHKVNQDNKWTQGSPLFGRDKAGYFNSILEAGPKSSIIHKKVYKENLYTENSLMFRRQMKILKRILTEGIIPLHSIKELTGYNELTISGKRNFLQGLYIAIDNTISFENRSGFTYISQRKAKRLMNDLKRY